MTKNKREIIIIAECCQNHNGDVDILKQMVCEAAHAGAAYVKIQTMYADELTKRERFELGKESIRRPYTEEYNRLKKLELTKEAHQEFLQECTRHHIKPLTTVFTQMSIPLVKDLGFSEIKVASSDCSSYPMITRLKEQFTNMFISTGMTFPEEIEKTAGIMKGKTYSFLHCVSIYPTPLDKLHLAKLHYLQRFTPTVGFSDHTLVKRDGLKAAKTAIVEGADIIERHFTILPENQTKDGPISINPEQLKELVEFTKLDTIEMNQYIKKEIPEWKTMIGMEHPCLSLEELRHRDYYRGRFASMINGKYLYNFEEYEHQKG
ncbi:MAG: N-acetylneuraminate synthase family protein [Methanobacteriota archaeon]